MNGISCPHCNQLNPDAQSSCERCGESLLWSTVSRGRGLKLQIPKPLLFALLGIGLGLTAARLAPSGSRPPAPVLTASAPRIDVVFALDATGSMGDEIEVVKSRVSRMMEQIQNGNPKPEVRYGLVAYRDYGDAYVSKSFPLTSSLSSIQASLEQVHAGGGGDTPEAVLAGLSTAVREMNWDLDPQTSRLVFLIGDAGAHRGDDLRPVLAEARQKGIKVNTWGCSGLQNHGQADFEEIAALGGGEFQFLTYQQEVMRADGSRARVLFQGSKAYEVDLKERWEEGADKLTTKASLDDRKVLAPGSAGKAEFSGGSYRPASTPLENNLDTALVRQVQSEAKLRGVRY